MALDRNRVSIVHFMAYPGPGQTNATLRGEAPRGYLLESMKEIIEDAYFGGIEITHIKDPGLREEVKQLLASSGMEITYSAQPIQLANEDHLIAPEDISSADELSRREAVDRILMLMDEAYEFGAKALGMISGRDPGTSSGLKARQQAYQALTTSLHEICLANKAKANELGREPLAITLELFDRLAEPGCKNQLVGPAREAMELAERLRQVYGHPEFGLLYDLSHMPLIKDTSFDSETPEILRVLAPYLNHIHLGSCVTKRESPLTGDSHPRFDHPDSAVGREELAAFVRVLQEIGYEKGVGFEIVPRGSELSRTVIGHMKTYYDEARNRIDVNYALGGYFFKSRRYLPEGLFEKITDVRVARREVITEEAANRKRRQSLTRNGKLMVLAADHPARNVTNVGSDPVGMGDRLDYLSRIARVMVHPEIDGLMATPDIIEDLFILNRLYKEAGGSSFLDEKVLLGSLNREGLAGYSIELEDKGTSYTPQTVHELNLDGAKLLMRFDPESKYSQRTMLYCAEAINRCNRYGLPMFLEPLPVTKTSSGYQVVMDADELIRVVGIASAMGDTSANLWLKIPYVNGYERVARATSLPILMLGGASTGNPVQTIEQFERGLGAGQNVRGAMVGRNVLYPGKDDPMAVAVAISRLIHQGATTAQVVRDLRGLRGTDMELLTSKILGNGYRVI